LFHSIYKDFLRFLDALETERPWQAYERYYYHPHKVFLESYWRTFHWMDIRQIQERVMRVKRKDYSNVLSLLHETDVENWAREVFSKCMDVLKFSEEPQVYLMIGFFSADGFVLEVEEKPVIGFGLERFQSWRPFPILCAHEYAHYLRHLHRRDEPYLSERYDATSRSLLSEGIATAFSEIVFPEYPLREHLFLSEERFRWCRSNEAYLKDVFITARKGGGNFALFWKGEPDLNVPPRVGSYLGYSYVKSYLKGNPVSGFMSLLEVDDIDAIMQDRAL
jgi:uncharacterized protein YjaZ